MPVCPRRLEASNSDTHRIVLPNDVIILSAIEAHSEKSTQFTQTAFVCLG